MPKLQSRGFLVGQLPGGNLALHYPRKGARRSPSEGQGLAGWYTRTMFTCLHESVCLCMYVCICMYVCMYA